MFENEWFPKASVMGITWNEFWKMNPHIINCIANGYREKQIEQDSLAHAWWGTYGLSAVSVAKRAGAVVGGLLAIILIFLVGVLLIVNRGPSKAFRDQFVMTVHTETVCLMEKAK